MEARVLEEALSVAQESSGVSAKIDLRDDACQRGFTIINHVIYKQANNNKWMQYNQQLLFHVCLLLNVVKGVHLNVIDCMI